VRPRIEDVGGRRQRERRQVVAERDGAGRRRRAEPR
jgi:hypothetical protein